MNALKDIVWSVLTSGRGMKLPRLIKEVYLVDWKCAFNYPPRPCAFRWFYGPCGPTSGKIAECVESNPSMFRVEETQNPSGLWVKTVYRNDLDYKPELTQEVQKAVDLVNKVATSKDWESLSLLVSSTYPILQSSMLDEIDMEKFAREYQELLRHRSSSEGQQPLLPSKLGDTTDACELRDCSK